MRRIGLAILALCAMVVPARPTLACSAEQPSFTEAIAGASAVARVVVEDVTEYGEPPAGETFRVVRVNPAWTATDHPIEPIIGFGATTPDGVASLDELERLILAALPDTAIPVGAGPAGLLGGVLLLVAAAVVVSRRLRPM